MAYMINGVSVDLPAPDLTGVDAGPPDLLEPDLLSDDEPFAAQRAACAYKAGATAASTLGPSLAGATIPIDTFVILVKENRSFDHYFSSLPAYSQTDVDVASAGKVNKSIAMTHAAAARHLPMFGAVRRSICCDIPKP